MRPPEINPFREVKPFLWDGQGLGYDSTLVDEFICIALALAYHAGRIDYELRDQARQIVMRRLDVPGVSINHVGVWLQHHGHAQLPISYSELQSYRHSWLDHLADEWDQGVRS